MPENKFKIGITQGDTNGIGWEIILKALADPRMTELFTPVVYGSPKAAAYYRNTVAEIEAFSFNPVASAAEARRGKANLVACGETADIAPGKPTPEAGRAAVEALCAAMRDLKAGHLDALVTAPFDKETVQADDFRYTGHTEYLAAELEGEAMMILCSDVLRVGLVTKHIPVSEIARNITKERIVRDLGTLRRALIEDFGIVEPRIAVMALNPHAGDGGLLGREEQEIIRPAIVEAFSKGAKKGMEAAWQLLPALTGMLLMLSLMNASGLTALLVRLLSPLTAILNLPQEVAPMLILRPMTGSGSLAALQEIFAQYGADSRVGRIASVLMGSSETIFYTMSVYLGAAGVKKLPGALGVSLLSYLTCAWVCGLIC